MGGKPWSLAVSALLTATAAVSCGSSTQAPATSGSFSDDGGASSLSGPQAFSVQSALVTTQEAMSACGYQSILPDGSYATIGVVLTDANIQSILCTDASASQIATVRASLSGHPFIVIQMKTINYPYSGNLADAGSVQPIGPGTYPIAFEGLSDDDLCMAAAGQALIDLRDWPDVDGGGAATVASALTGTLTLTTVMPGHIVGSFDVKMSPLLSTGQFDRTNTTPLSASFDATSCGM